MLVLLIANLMEPSHSLKLQNKVQINSQIGISMPDIVKNGNTFAVMMNLAQQTEPGTAEVSAEEAADESVVRATPPEPVQLPATAADQQVL